MDGCLIGCTTCLRSVWRVRVRNVGFVWNGNTPPILRNTAACVGDGTGETAEETSLSVARVTIRIMRMSTRHTTWPFWGWREVMVSVRYQSQCAVQKSKVLANHSFSLSSYTPL